MALTADGLVVEVSKCTAHAAPPASAAANGKRVVCTDGETASVDGASLGRAVELELAVGDNGACALELVMQDTVLEGAEEIAIGCLAQEIHVSM